MLGDARRRSLARERSCSIGLGSGGGMNASRLSRSPSARTTRIRLVTWLDSPFSSRISVRFETPASRASWAWVRLRRRRCRASRSPISVKTAESVIGRRFAISASSGNYIVYMVLRRQLWHFNPRDSVESRHLCGPASPRPRQDAFGRALASQCQTQVHVFM